MTQNEIVALAADKIEKRDALAAQIAKLDAELRGIKAQYMVAGNVWGLGETAFRNEVRRLSPLSSAH